MAHLNHAQKFFIYRTLSSETKTSKSSLAKEIGCKRDTIYKLIQKFYSPNGNLVNFFPSKNQRNRKNIYTKQQEVNVMSFFDLFPFASFMDCKRLLDLPFTIFTIRNILKRNLVGTYVAKRKPFMNLSHQAKRYTLVYFSIQNNLFER